MSSRHQSRNNNQYNRAIEPGGDVVPPARPARGHADEYDLKQKNTKTTPALGKEIDMGSYRQYQNQPKSAEDLDLPQVRSRTPSDVSNDGEGRSQMDTGRTVQQIESERDYRRSTSKRQSQTGSFHDHVDTKGRSSNSSYRYESEDAYQAANRYQAENRARRLEREAKPGGKRYSQTENYHQADEMDKYTTSPQRLASQNSYRYERDEEYQYRQTEDQYYRRERGSNPRKDGESGKKFSEWSSRWDHRDDNDEIYTQGQISRSEDVPDREEMKRRGPVARNDQYESGQSLDSDFYQYHSGSGDFRDTMQKQNYRRAPTRTNERSYQASQRKRQQNERSASFSGQDDSDTLGPGSPYWASDESDSQLEEQWDPELRGSGSVSSVFTGRDDPRRITNMQAQIRQRQPEEFDRRNVTKADQLTRKLSSTPDGSYKGSSTKAIQRGTSSENAASTESKGSTSDAAPRASTANKGSGVKWSNPITEDEPSDFMRYFSRPDEESEAAEPISKSTATGVQVQAEKDTKVQDGAMKDSSNGVRSILASETADSKEPKKQTPYLLRTESLSSAQPLEERRHSAYGIRSLLESENSEPKEFRKHGPYPLRSPSDFSSSVQNDGVETSHSSTGRRMSETSDGRYPE